MNYCVDCKYHKKTDSGYHYCHHPELERKPVTSPVTGRIIHHIDENGERVNKHPKCSEINQGKCGLYEEREKFNFCKVIGGIFKGNKKKGD